MRHLLDGTLVAQACGVAAVVWVVTSFGLVMWAHGYLNRKRGNRED